MKRLLCIVSGMNTGGAETFLMKLFRTIDKSSYGMDFCVNEEENYYAKEIEDGGGRIFVVPSKSKDPIGSFNAIRRIVSENGYKYVLRVNEHSLATIDLLAAKKGGAEVLAMRSSNADSDGKLNGLLHKAFKPLAGAVPQIKIAPSELAAEYTFGKNAVRRGEVLILHNGIDLDRFRFDPAGRNEIRNMFGIPQDALLIGHIGRFNKQKNHAYLIKAFAAAVTKRPDAMLMLVGGGELGSEVRKAADDVGIADKVIFAGIRSDVPQLLSAMDVLALPSLYEGMPNVVIEAQAVGVPCVISDTITREANVTGNVKYLSIDLPPEDWADALIEKKQIVRGDAASIMKSRGYSIFDVRDEFTRAVFGEDERN